MLYLNFDNYLNECKTKGNLVKITPEIVMDSEVDQDFVTKTKEIYEFYSESGWENEAECSDAEAAADAFIKACCADSSCLDHRKKFKKGKYNKKEDEVAEYGKFIVTVGFTHEE